MRFSDKLRKVEKESDTYKFIKATHQIPPIAHQIFFSFGYYFLFDFAYFPMDWLKF